MIQKIGDKLADRIRVGYLAAFLLLLLSYVLTFFSTRKLIEQARLANHTSEVIHNLDIIIAHLARAESDFRGYLVTNSTYLLDDYRRSHNQADSGLANAKILTFENSDQQKFLDTLSNLMNMKFGWMEKNLASFKLTSEVSDPLVIDIIREITTMTRLEDYIHMIQANERASLDQRSERITSYSNTIKIINIFSIFLAIIFTVYSILTFNKENKAKLEADQQSSEYQAQLARRFDELAALNSELIELRNIEKFAVTGRISRTIAHEVRNPLTNINLAVEHLRSEVDVSEDTSMLFEMITRNTTRINELISNLLNSTRTTELQFTKASINEVLDKSLEFAQDRIELNQIKVVKEYDADICGILVNEEKISIAFLNIIVNAIEAMEPGGTLSITTENVKNRCVVKITDNGKGMSRADVGRLFEPYFTTKEKGHGLGLTNTQNIILSHNASIAAESEPGVGTSFIISFDYRGGNANS